MIQLLLLTLISLWLVKKWLAYHEFTSKLNFLPQFKGLPVLGVLLEMMDPEFILPAGVKFFNTINTSFVAYMGPKPYVVVCDPELNEVIMGSNVLIEKNSEYKMLNSWFGDGLLTSKGNKWKTHRKILTPSFHYKILEEFVPVFDRASRIMVENLQKVVGKPSCDIYSYATLCTLDVICETAMGTQINAQEQPDQPYIKSVKDMCDIMFMRVFTLIRFDWIYWLTIYYQRERKAIKVMRKFSDTVIENRRKVLENQQTEEENESDDFGVKRKFTFLDVLLKATTVNGQKLTDQQIREEVDTFIFEGHDTTGVALSFACFLLSNNLDIQQKVYQEIVDVIGTDKKKSVTLDNLHNLNYTEMVIKEALRLYPSVVGFGRHIQEDVPYKTGVIPAGTEIVFSPYLLHRNPDIYPEPEKFDPERFTTENSSKRHPYAYVPFSAGPRNCIGQKFAMLELKSTLAKILRFYELHPALPAHSLKVVSKVTIQSSTGIKIRLKERL